MKSTALTVTQLNVYIKSMLDGDPNLSGVFVVGELSNFTNHYRSGHFYFSLKDDRCALKCVMFASSASRVRFRPQDGMRVLVRGRVSVYEASGQYQLYVEDMQPDGVGALSLAFEQLKKKLAQEGLFSPERKKPLPRLPRRVGVVTSPTGAAIQDIKQILRRRFPLSEMVFCPVLVQGEEAPAQIIEAIRRFNESNAADVLIVGRGGGSMEDLWAFNNEGVARAVAASRIPVISAVGHETDFTICDLAADLRAPTPSAAAELAVPDQAKVKAQIESLAGELRRIERTMVERQRLRLQQLLQSRIMRNPRELVENRRMRLDTAYSELSYQYLQGLTKHQKRFSQLMAKLDALNPMQVLGRGYSIVQNRQGGVVKSINETEIGQNLNIRLSDGRLGCIVQSIEREESDEESIL